MSTTGPSSERFRDTNVRSTFGNSCVCHRSESKNREYKTIHGHSNAANKSNRENGMISLNNIRAQVSDGIIRFNSELSLVE